MLHTATQSTTARLAQRSIDALTSEEAISLYVELLTITRSAGHGLRRFSESIALDIIHGAFYFATLAVWGLAELWELGRVALRREVIAFRSALIEAVQDTRSRELPQQLLAQASDSLNIEWPDFSKQVQGLQGAIATTDAHLAAMKERVGLS